MTSVNNDVEQSHDELPNDLLVNRRGFMGTCLAASFVPIASLISPAAEATNWVKESARFEADPFEGLDICPVATAAVEGPYYIDNRIFRSDITEGQSGYPIELNIKIVNSNNNCTPVANALVSIWHCNAKGEYSGYLFSNPDVEADLSGADASGHVKSRDEERFLRGVQVSDSLGRVKFKTIVPGWYNPRAVHFHIKVFIENRVYVSTQLYLPQSLTNIIHSTHSDYKDRGVSIFTNENDTVRIQSGISGNTDIMRVVYNEPGTLIASATLGTTA
ncbi:dioxygenase family protein [Carnimonas bestiolae]|uniref:dioxygenase family protein n=1 Tax=Carnimonas bestiolae TaxID=3402172 RepID=UPI003EDBBB1F